MNPQELIDAYVDDVVRQLPRKQRADVGTELRELLSEELAAEAHASGKTPDQAMTLDFLNAFGRPEEVAARYKPAGFNIIDPAYSRNFLRAAVIGVLVLWTLGLIATFTNPANKGRDLNILIGEWWIQASFVSLFWWPGFLLVCTGVATWARHRWPKRSAWRPSVDQQAHRFWIGTVAFAPFGLAWLIFLISPRFFLGLILPVGTDTSWAAYDPAFQHWRLAPLLILTALSLALQIRIAIRKRWQPAERWADIGLSTATGAVMLWCVLAGPIIQFAPVDGLIRLMFAIIVFFTVIGTGMKIYRNIGRTRLPAHVLKPNGA